MAILTLLTDFGTRDYYVAAVKGVILSEAPRTTIVDVSHEVEPGNVAGAGFLLSAAAPNFPPATVHLAVVDPGVGSERRMLLVEAHDALFLAPDNGLLTAQLATGTAWAVTRPDLYRAAPGATFHGRDRFAPLAAALLNRAKPTELGHRIEDAVRLPVTATRRQGGFLYGSIVHIDRFGNLVTDLPSAWLAGKTGALAVAVDGRERSARLATHYTELAEDEIGVLAGSLQTLELSLRGRSLAQQWLVETGAPVTIRFG